ncbi:MAG: hypothetical protein RLZZ618_1798 [Pseudomonadota bacterium]|jgi:hypothetical protein
MSTRQPWTAESLAEAPAEAVIRGQHLKLDELLNPKLRDGAYLHGLHEQLLAASPFPYLVVEDWFNPVLLRLVRDEFHSGPELPWSTEINRYARVERSRDHARLGPASQLYFNALHSAFFLDVLFQVSGIAGLVADPHLVGGGLHETENGGSFGIHTDFDRHPHTALNNEMVLITYLNDHWQPEWNGALELWDAQAHACVRQIEPRFGRSVLLTHGAAHFHGHPTPLSVPPGITRRSLAAYFYANRFAREDRRPAMLSRFMFTTRGDRVRHALEQWLPPVLVRWLKGMRRS